MGVIGSMLTLRPLRKRQSDMRGNDVFSRRIPDEHDETRSAPSRAENEAMERGRIESAERRREEIAAARISSGVAHNFNDILQTVVGSLDLLIEQAEAGRPVRKFVDSALIAATRGSYLTHHLLCYAGVLPLWTQAIDLPAFLSDFEQFLSGTVGSHVIIYRVVETVPRVLADPEELRTALRNLAINATQAMPRGGTLQIGAKEERESGKPWVKITVTDTGAGMDEATLAQAVEPFFTTKGASAIGLGLSMVQGFARQSGGTLRIASAPGRGTVVELRLPVADAVDAGPDRRTDTRP
jgi:signal transduction histidine kinase